MGTFAERIGLPPVFRDRSYRRLKATDFTWYDPGARFNGANPAENGGGTAMTVLLKGSNAIASLIIPDFAAECYGVMPLPDAWGVQVTGDIEMTPQIRIRFGTAPGVNDNVYVAMGIINESDITGTTGNASNATATATADLGQVVRS